MLDAVLEAGRGHGIRPFGEEALMMLRIEAGLPLIDIEWHDARLAFSDADTGDAQGARLRLDAARRPRRRRARFVGSRGDPARAGRRHVALGDHRHRRRLGGLGPALPRRRPVPAQVRAPAALRVDAVSTGDDDRNEVGYCTSFVYSPVLQRHIGIARVRPDLAAAGTELRLELAVNHHNTTVRVTHDDDAVLRPCPEEG